MNESTTQNVWQQFYQQIHDHFNFEELWELTFNLHVDYEDLGEGLGKKERIIKLIVFMGKNDRLTDLLAGLKEARPKLWWPDEEDLLQTVDYLSFFKSPPSPRLRPFQVPISNSIHFVGRNSVVAQIENHIEEKTGQKIICLVGMGGIGKTTLAIELANTLQTQFPDGVLWADIARSRQTLAILDSWATAYGYDFSQLTSVPERAAAVRSALKQKKGLMILDDVKQANEIFDLLPNGPNWTVILTTRNKLLSLDIGAMNIELKTLTHLDSYQLLVQFLGEERVVAEQEAAYRIGKRLEHLPLALHLVVGLLSVHEFMSLADLAERLQSQTGLLTELHGHRIRQSFNISWELLTEQLQGIFAMMGVFAGRPFDVSALISVAQTSRPEIESALFELMAHYLVQQETISHYRQHSILADFAHEKLNNRQHVYTRKVQYYLNLVQLNEEITPENLRVLDQEWDNIWVARIWAKENLSIDVQLDFCFALWQYTEMRGRWQSEAELVEEVLIIYLQSSNKDPDITAKLQYIYGIYLYRLNKFDKAKFQLRKSLDNSIENNETKISQRNRHALGLILVEEAELQNERSLQENKYREALTEFKESLQLIKREDTVQFVTVKTKIADCYSALNDPREALIHIQECYQRLDPDSLADYRLLAYTHYSQGLAFHVANELDQAREGYVKALRYGRELKEPRLIAQTLANLAQVHLQEGRLLIAQIWLKKVKKFNPLPVGLEHFMQYLETELARKLLINPP